MSSLVSIIIPCYNSAVYIEETLRSVIAQTYKQWECIIVDNGSTDATAALVKKIVEQHPAIQYYSVPEKGVSRARNYGISQSKGLYILPLDSDDKIHSTYIEKAVAV